MFSKGHRCPLPKNHPMTRKDWEGVSTFSLGMAPVGGGGVTGRSSTQECLRERNRNSLLSSRQFLSLYRRQELQRIARCSSATRASSNCGWSTDLPSSL